MSDLALQILEPANGAGFVEGTPVRLYALATGNLTGLFFKWFSSSNSAATKEQPELNPDHSATMLDWFAPLPEFGTHALTLAATDQDRLDPESVAAVTRSAMAGGAPAPGSPPQRVPCVIHRLVAKILTPSADGLSLSKANATIEVLAPMRWALPDPNHPEVGIVDSDYEELNAITIVIRLAQESASASSQSADIALDLTSATPTPCFFATDPSDDTCKLWFRWSGALPPNLGTGPHILTLTVAGGGISTSTTRNVVLTA